MTASLDCLPCFIRQALETARIASPDPGIHALALRDVLRWASEFDMNQPSPVMAQRIHRLLREITGVEDPYRDAKTLHNRMAMGLLPEMKDEIDASADPLIMAVRLAISGNVIDMGINANVSEDDVRRSIRQALEKPFFGKPEEFRDAAVRATRILYLADNSGEIVFDRLLIERLSPERVTVVVRGAPIINDATMSEARAVGLDAIVEVIDNGSDAPGTILGECSQELKRRFAEADMIIAKGQGNLETLSEEPGNIFYLLQAKCPVIAQRLRVPVGAHVLARDVR